MANSAFRLQVKGPTGAVNYYPLPIGRSLIGRDASCDLSLRDDALVSRNHAQIECTDETCQIMDLGSDTGTFLGTGAGKLRLLPRTPFPVQPDNQLEIGRYQLTLQRESIGRAQDTTSPTEPMRQPIIKRPRPYQGEVPPRLRHENSLRLLQYLPAIYQPEPSSVANGMGSIAILYPAPFIERFLALFESVLLPLEWQVDHFAFYLDLKTTPGEFLSWLESWFDLPFATTWSETQRRAALAIAPQLFARRGTPWALIQILQIYLALPFTVANPTAPNSVMTLDDLSKPNTVIVKLDLEEEQVDGHRLRQLIEAFIPAQATLELKFKQSSTT